jgi:uncharacterized membrane protein YqjE
MENQEKSRLFKFLKIDTIVENLTGLIEARLELVKIELKEELAKIGARVIAGVVFAFLAVMIIIFFNFWMANLLNSLIGSLWAGYAIVTGFYFLILILLIAFRVPKVLQEKIEDSLMQNVDSEDDGDEGGA